MNSSTFRKSNRQHTKALKGEKRTPWLKTVLATNGKKSTSEINEQIQLVPVAKIDVGNRHRKEYGDLQSLANSIKELGLLQPIGITEDFQLVFGGRRLCACRDVLKLKKIEARIVKVSSIIRGEHDENELRKDFTPSERVAIAKALENEVAERRGNPSIRRNCDELDGRTDELVAKKAGFASKDTYRRAKKVVDCGSADLIEAMDAGKIAISTAARLTRLPIKEQHELLALDVHEIRQAAGKHQLNGHASAASKKQSESHSGTNNWMTAIIADLKNHWKTVEAILAPICDVERDVKLKLIEKRVLVGKLHEINELHRDLERALPADGVVKL